MTRISRLKNLFVCSLVSMLSFYTLAEETENEYFDYTETYRLWVHNWQDTASAALINPLSSNPEEIRASGRALYGLILPYMAGAEQMVIPMPEEPQYIVDLLAPDRYKRLYLGSGWINDGKVVAFLSDDDWNSVVKIIESRLERGSSDIASTSLIENKYTGVDRIQDVTREQEFVSILEALERVRALGDRIDNLDSSGSADSDWYGIEPSGEVAGAATDSTLDNGRIRDQDLTITSASQQMFEATNQDASERSPPKVQASNRSGMGWLGYWLVVAAVFGLAILGWAAIRRKGVG